MILFSKLNKNFTCHLFQENGTGSRPKNQVDQLAVTRAKLEQTYKNSPGIPSTAPSELGTPSSLEDTKARLERLFQSSASLPSDEKSNQTKQLEAQTQSRISNAGSAYFQFDNSPIAKDKEFNPQPFELKNSPLQTPSKTEGLLPAAELVKTRIEDNATELLNNSTTENLPPIKEAGFDSILQNPEIKPGVESSLEVRQEGISRIAKMLETGKNIWGDLKKELKKDLENSFQLRGKEHSQDGQAHNFELYNNYTKPPVETQPQQPEVQQEKPTQPLADEAPFSGLSSNRREQVPVVNTSEELLQDDYEELQPFLSMQPRPESQRVEYRSVINREIEKLDVAKQEVLDSNLSPKIKEQLTGILDARMKEVEDKVASSSQPKQLESKKEDTDKEVVTQAPPNKYVFYPPSSKNIFNGSENVARKVPVNYGPLPSVSKPGYIDSESAPRPPEIESKENLKFTVNIKDTEQATTELLDAYGQTWDAVREKGQDAHLGNMIDMVGVEKLMAIRTLTEKKAEDSDPRQAALQVWQVLNASGEAREKLQEGKMKRMTEHLDALGVEQFSLPKGMSSRADRGRAAFEIMQFTNLCIQESGESKDLLQTLQTLGGQDRFANVAKVFGEEVVNELVSENNPQISKFSMESILKGEIDVDLIPDLKDDINRVLAKVLEIKEEK